MEDSKDIKILVITANPASKSIMFNKFDTKIMNNLSSESYENSKIQLEFFEPEVKVLNRSKVAKNMVRIKNADIIFYYIDKNINQSSSLALCLSKDILDKTVLLMDFDPNKPIPEFAEFQYNLVYEFSLFTLNSSDTTSIIQMIDKKIAEKKNKDENEKNNK